MKQTAANADTTPKRNYINVMEILVAKEVDRQLGQLPQRVLKYVKRVEVETFALNRLPALYASSEKGWEHQCDKAQRDYRAQLTSAVRQALAAVQVDPIRLSQPLDLADESESNAILQTLRDLLQQPELSWDGLVRWVKQVRQGKLANRPDSSEDASDRAPAKRLSWRPGTYGNNVSWHPKPHRANSSSVYGWDDPHYRI